MPFAKFFQWIGVATFCLVIVGLSGYFFFLRVVPDPPLGPFGSFEINGKPATTIIQIFRAPGSPPFADEENWTPTDWDAKIAHQLTYVDPSGRRWEVPEGQINDGASVPLALHSFLGGGHNGLFLGAAIVHDRYCQLEQARKDLNVTWPEVHRMFYHAMRASEVPDKKAKVMYGAVICFGPPKSRNYLARYLSIFDPEASERVKKAYPSWEGWISNDTSTAELKVSNLRQGYDDTAVQLEKATQDGDQLKLAVNRLREQMSARQNQADPADDLHFIQELQQLKSDTDRAENQRITLEKKQSDISEKIASAVASLESLRHEETEDQLIAEAFLKELETNAENMNLDQIEKIALQASRKLENQD